MNEFVQLINPNGSWTWQPDMVIRLIGIFIVLECMISIFEILVKGLRR